MSKRVDDLLETINQLSQDEREELIRRLLSNKEDQDYYTLLDQMLSEDWDNEKDDIYNDY